MNNYFRITAHHPKNNITAIFDSYGKYEKLWQFSAFLVQRGFNIIAVGDESKFTDGNLGKIDYDTEHIYLRAAERGESRKDGKFIQVKELRYAVAM